MTLTNSHNWTPQDDLDWLAFQYVSAELTDDESVAFEGRLSQEQEAREAVARCVRMTHAVVSLADSESASPVLIKRPAGWRRIRTWAAATIVIAAIVSAYLAGARDSEPDGIPPVGVGPGQRALVRQDVNSEISAASLVLAWVNSIESQAADAEQIGGFPRFEETAQAGPTFAETEAETVVDGKFDWVIAALADNPTVGGNDNGREDREQN